MPKGILKKPGQKRKKNTRHIRFNPNYDETWSALHPDIENEFFEANIEERSNLMAKYLQGHLIANYKPSKPVISDEALDRAKAKLERAIAKGKIEPTIDIEAEALKYVTEKAKTVAEEEDQKYLAAVKKLTTSYTVAIDLAIFAKKVDSWNVCKRLLQDKEISELILYKVSEDAINKYINNNLADIQDDPEAVAFREKRAEQTSAPDYFDKKWRKNHPKPTLEYGKADRDARQIMIHEYLVMCMMKASEDKDEFLIRSAVNSDTGKNFISRLSEHAENWASCKEILTDTNLHNLLFACNGEEISEEAEQNMKKYFKENINTLDTSPLELEYRERNGLIERNKNATNRHLFEVRTATQTALTDINKVDYKLGGLGSGAFDEMKKAITEFQKFTMEKYRLNEKGEIPDALYEAFIEKSTKAINSIKAYLDYKVHQFELKPDRRNSPKRQKREQPRIMTAIKVLGDIEKMYFEQTLAAPGMVHYDNSFDDIKREAFENDSANRTQEYIKKLASKQTKDQIYTREDNPFYNDQDKALAAAEKKALEEAKKKALEDAKKKALEDAKKKAKKKEDLKKNAPKADSEPKSDIKPKANTKPKTKQNSKSGITR